MNQYEATETYKVLLNGENRNYIRASTEFRDWYLSYWKKLGFEPVERRGKHVTSWHLERRDY